MNQNVCLLNQIRLSLTSYRRNLHPVCQASSIQTLKELALESIGREVDPKMVETCEKRNQIPKCVLSLVDKHDSEEEKVGRGGEKKERGEERKKDKGTSKRMFSVVV